LTFNGRNGRALARRFGWEDTNWLKKLVTFSPGTYEKDGELRRTILLDPPPLSESDRKPPHMLDPDDPDFHF
jgi:hypothetical protein